MREYHAMFLEQLTVADLKRKLAKKCGMQESEIITIMKYEHFLNKSEKLFLLIYTLIPYTLSIVQVDCKFEAFMSD